MLSSMLLFLLIVICGLNRTVCQNIDEDATTEHSRSLITSINHNGRAGLLNNDYVRYKRNNKNTVSITSHFEEKVVSPSSDVSLQCTGTGDNPPRFEWSRDDFIITSYADPRYTLGQVMASDGSVVTQLNVTSVRVEDGGLYTCRAIVDENTAVYSSRLNVFGPPYIRNLPTVKVQSGMKLKLKCPYYGYPISSVEWEHEGKKISSINSRYKRNEQLNNNEKTLKYNIDYKIFIDLDKTDFKKYITNANHKIELNSYFENTNKSNHSIVSKLIENTIYSVNDKYQDSHLLEDPHTFYKEDSVINNDDLERSKRGTVTVDNNSLLTIDSISSDNNGIKYTCIVKSPSGEMARRSFEINVVEGPVLEELLMGTNLQEGKIVQITCNLISGDSPIFFSWLKDGKKIPAVLKIEERTSELFSVLVIRKVALEHCGKYTCTAANHVAKDSKTAELYIKVAPKWISEPSNTSLLLGERGAVICSASGYPQPQVHWMKNDEHSGSWRPVLELTGGNALSLPNGSLLIEHVSMTDQGMYSCSVENGVGNPLHKIIWIKVNKAARINGGDSIHNVRVGAGGVTRASCTACGDIPLSVTWRRLGYNPGRYRLSESKIDQCIESTLYIEYTQTSDSGEYECKASNTYGSDIQLYNIDVQEPPLSPTQMSVWQIRSRSAQLSWHHNDEQTTYYSIYTTILTTSHSTNTFNVTRVKGSSRQSTDLVSLIPATSYSVRVAAGNEVGISEYTQPVVFNTLEESPTSAPLSVIAVQTENPGELHIAWLPPSKETHNGFLLGYYVKAVPQINSAHSVSDEAFTHTVKSTSQTNKHEVILNNLKKNTKYSISVCAFNSVGKGPYSQPVFRNTREGSPEIAPQSIECNALTSTSLKVIWQSIPIEDQGGSLLGYNLLYASEDEPWLNMTTSYHEIVLQSLLKYTNYTIKVAGYSNYGVGPYSSPIHCTTLEDIPGPPASTKVIVSSSSSLLISWKRPLHINCVILQYNVYAKLSDSKEQPMLYRVSATDNHMEWKTHFYELKGLLSNKEYSAWVCARCGTGEGQCGNKVRNIPRGGPRPAECWALGGRVIVARGGSLSLQCGARGDPPPQTNWSSGDSHGALVLNDLDVSMNGNYTCLVSNTYGSDSVSYLVTVPSPPDTPELTAIAHRNNIDIEWSNTFIDDERRNVRPYRYTLTWREIMGTWQLALSDATPSINEGRYYKYTIQNLKCGTKYMIRITAISKYGISEPGYLEVTTLGGVPKAPTSTDWFWSNSTQILVHLTGWDENGCEITKWDIDYRQTGNKLWIRADNKIQTYSDHSTSWSQSELYRSEIGTNTQPKSFAIGDLTAGLWYQIRVTAQNDAGSTTSHFNYATKTKDGLEIQPISEFMDLSIAVIIFSSILLFICFLICLYIAVKRNRHTHLTEYRSSITTAVSAGVASDYGKCASASTLTTNDLASAEHRLHHQRLYSAPINTNATKETKNEMYEISPYAQFSLGFRTFGHVDNQEVPTFVKNKTYNTETSFQTYSESEDSCDSLSKTTTLKSIQAKGSRLGHRHHR